MEKKKPQETWGHQQKRLSDSNQSRPLPNVNTDNDHIERRRNAVSCYRTRSSDEPHYFGVIVLENLPEGEKVAVSVGVREIKRGKRGGQKYLSITLRPLGQAGGER